MALSSDEVVTVTIDDEFWGEWEQYTGGEQTRPNVQRRTRVYPARKRIGEVTVRTIFDHERLHALVRKLDTTKRALPMIVTRQPVDSDGNVGAYKPRVDTGWVATDNAGEVNTEDDTEQMLEVTMTVESRA